MTVELEGNRWQRLQPRERALTIIFGMIALLAVVYLLLFSGGGEEPEALPPPGSNSTSTPGPRPTVVPTPTPTRSSPPETFEVFEGKDPFRPLITVVETPAPGGDTPGPGPTGGPTSDAGQRVTLVNISGSGDNRVATVEVDGSEYNVSEGDTFAGSYRVVSLSASCGTFVFGDEQFTLCEGQEVLK